MPKYRALEKGYHDDQIRNPGDVFISPVAYPRNITRMVQGKEKKIRVEMPSWLEAVDEETNETESDHHDRPAILQNAIKKMMKEDPEKQNVDYWHGAKGLPSMEELKKRTPLRDITHAEREQAFNAVMRPPSGKTEMA